MRKKHDIAEKLEKLSKDGSEDDLVILGPKKASGIEEKPKVAVGPSGKPISSSIKDLTIPESAFELFTLELATDPQEKERASQLLGLREDPDAKVQFTVLKDPDSKEFEDIKSENLKLIKSYLPIYGGEFDGSVLISHQGDYTFSIASRELKISDLLRLFEYALESAWKYELKA
jgi:hypothetical protein